jgi:Ca2+-dependent lipid-binding protein
MEKGVNILNLPLISNFVNYAIKAAASSTSSLFTNALEVC